MRTSVESEMKSRSHSRHAFFRVLPWWRLEVEDLFRTCAGGNATFPESDLKVSSVCDLDVRFGA